MCYGFCAVFWHFGQFNCVWRCSQPNQALAAVSHPCCAQPSLLDGWEGCLLSCYPVYIIHYLLATARVAYKACGYSLGKAVSFMCAFSFSILTVLSWHNFRLHVKILPYLAFLGCCFSPSSLFSGGFIMCCWQPSGEPCRCLSAPHWSGQHLPQGWSLGMVQRWNVQQSSCCWKLVTSVERRQEGL